MTQAYDLLLDGEIVRAIIEVFTNIVGEPFFYFMCFAMLSAVLYVGTRNVAMPLVLGLLGLGALAGSHIADFARIGGAFVPETLIPGEFMGYVYLVFVLGLTYVVYRAATS